MTTEYYTGVEGFQADEGGSSYYVGTPDTLVGADEFVVAALFMMGVPFAGPGQQTIFANTDAGGDGWALSCDPATGEIRFAIGTDLATAAVVLGPGATALGAGGAWTRVPILVLASLQGGATLVMSANNAGVPDVSQAMGGAVYAPPAGGSAPTVGVANSAAPAVPAPDCTVLGVAYTTDLAGLQQPGLDFYLSCRESRKLNNPFETDPSLGDFQNRWTAQDGNYRPDATGAAQAVWTPSAGAQSLTRVGSPTVRGFKDLDWQYTWAESSTEDPAA